MCDIVFKTFTSAISSPDEFLLFLPLESIQSFFFGMYVAYKKGTYQNFRQSLTVTVHILLSHDAKVNKPMWAWQLCDVASVNK